MLDYIKAKRTAQFLVIGTVLMILGLIFHYRIELLGHAFFLPIGFLSGLLCVKESHP